MIVNCEVHIGSEFVIVVVLLLFVGDSEILGPFDTEFDCCLWFGLLFMGSEVVF